MNLSSDPGLSYFPRIATGGNNSVYVVWTDNSLGNHNILFTKSGDGGASFDKPIILSNLKGVSNFPSIVASRNNNVYVVWSHKNNTDFDPSNTENQTQTYDVFFTKSLDRGRTFSKPVNINDDPANSQGPAVAISDNNTVYVVWIDNSIGTYETFFTKSLDQ
ncbi:MAG: sialidase family protein [Candidatus Nitrosopolaris sp.]